MWVLDLYQKLLEAWEKKIKIDWCCVARYWKCEIIAQIKEIPKIQYLPLQEFTEIWDIWHPTTWKYEISNQTLTNTKKKSPRRIKHG